MPGRVAHLWRHPIKGHGVESVDRVTLETGSTMPWDRVWAIAHEAARLKDATAWAPSANFSQGARSPELMAIRTEVDEAAGRLRLSHPRREAIEIDPDDPEDQARLIAWVTPLSNASRARPAAVVRAGRGMTDTDFPSISVLSLATLRALSDRAGRPLAMERFRGNVWLDGLEPWDEFAWIGREIRLGAVTLAVRERITRCKATTVDPAAGRADVDTLKLLEQHWGHRDFGVYAEVTRGGTLAVGDEVALPGRAAA